MERTRFEPPVSEDGEPFWEATRGGRLVLPWCRSCTRPFWYPRARCPSCHGGDIEWRDATGLGRIHALSVQHRPANPLMAERVPYTVVLVDLDEGVRVMSNLVGDAAVGDAAVGDAAVGDAAVGDRVRVCWEPLSDGRQLPQFERT